MRVRVYKPLRSRESWKRSPEAQRRQNQRYYKKHREEELTRSSNYRKENKDIINLKRRTRYAKKKILNQL